MIAITASGPALAASSDPHAADHAGTHATHPHHVSLLLGAADNGAIHETGFTIGAGYRYNLGGGFAVGPMFDFASYDSENTTLLLAALFWKPVGNLILLTGPGVEWAHHKEHGSDTVLPTAATTAAGEAEDGGGTFAYRVGAGYEFHAGKISITPGVGLDFIEEHTTKIYAVSFGMGFD